MPANTTIWYGVHFAIVTAQPNVKVVSARLVVKLAGAIDAVALASTSVQLGLPLLSVSNLIFKLADGLNTFASASFKVFPATQLPICLHDTLVFPATSPILFPFTASAKVGQVSGNKLSHLVIASPAR